MQPMNPAGDPRSYHRWSVWRPMDALGFAENVSEWKWTDDSTDALISNVHDALVKCGPRLVHFDHFFIGCVASADYWFADYPELKRTTQPSTIGGPLGESGFCSTAGVTAALHFAMDIFQNGWWDLAFFLAAFKKFRDSPTIWCLCAFSSMLFHFYVPFYVKKEKIYNFMCLLEFECIKRLKAHSQAIPEN